MGYFLAWTEGLPQRNTATFLYVYLSLDSKLDRTSGEPSSQDPHHPRPPPAGVKTCVFLWDLHISATNPQATAVPIARESFGLPARGMLTSIRKLRGVAKSRKCCVLFRTSSPAAQLRHQTKSPEIGAASSG
ncbi:hypothetical protein BV898_19191 [Hypsibius exemplaris]|uniref:Uncharacterized protein n=1 Tax=Hypsibius exemplaris TaxID=2072580 RepID=A0A9X6NJ40_HYPEX|nr:hypothetical protein BV898_19191 [Hypsibius exemplaris]